MFRSQFLSSPSSLNLYCQCIRANRKNATGGVRLACNGLTSIPFDRKWGKHYLYLFHVLREIYNGGQKS